VFGTYFFSVAAAAAGSSYVSCRPLSSAAGWRRREERDRLRVDADRLGVDREHHGVRGPRLVADGLAGQVLRAVDAQTLQRHDRGHRPLVDHADGGHRELLLGEGDDGGGEVADAVVGLTAGDQLHHVDGAAAGRDLDVESRVLEVPLLERDVRVRLASEGVERRQVADLLQPVVGCLAAVVTAVARTHQGEPQDRHQGDDGTPQPHIDLSRPDI
jgi:hypothetical protein